MPISISNCPNSNTPCPPKPAILIASDVCLSEERIGSPLISHPDVLIAMNEISLRKFAADVAADGMILYNRDSLPADFVPAQARVICVPAADMADKLGSTKAANIVMLGAPLEETECLPSSTALDVLKDRVKKVDLLQIDRNALAAARRFIERQAHVCAVSQPDGFAD